MLIKFCLFGFFHILGHLLFRIEFIALVRLKLDIRDPEIIPDIGVLEVLLVQLALSSPFDRQN